MDTTYLAHHGVKGMRWGVITKATRSTSTLLSEGSKLGAKSSKSKTVKKDYSKMSDDELKAKVKRLNLEKSYGELTGDTKKVRSGSDYVHEILQNTAIAVGMASTAIGLYLTIKGRK